MIAELLRDGRLVAPFPKKFDSARGYYVLIAPHARGRPEVEAFVEWLRVEATAVAGPIAAVARARRLASKSSPTARERLKRP